MLFSFTRTHCVNSCGLLLKKMQVKPHEPIHKAVVLYALRSFYLYTHTYTPMTQGLLVGVLTTNHNLLMIALKNKS